MANILRRAATGLFNASARGQDCRGSSNSQYFSHGCSPDGKWLVAWRTRDKDRLQFTTFRGGGAVNLS